jgi:hypothetical protein
MLNNITNNEFLILNLFLSDYGRKIHIREISKLINKNHVSVMQSLNKLEEEAVLRYEYVGKSKCFYLNLENILVKNIINILERHKCLFFLSENFNVRKFLFEVISFLNVGIIIFGSYAKLENNKKSDLDLLFLKKISSLI